MSRLFKAAFFGVLIGVAGLVASFSHFAHDIEEDVGLGLLFQLRGVKKAPSDVVVISIDTNRPRSLIFLITPIDGLVLSMHIWLKTLREKARRSLSLTYILSSPAPPTKTIPL